MTDAKDGSQVLISYVEQATKHGSAQSATNDDQAKQTITALLKSTRKSEDGDKIAEASGTLIRFTQSPWIRERNKESDLDNLVGLVPELRAQAGNDYEQFGWEVRDAWNYDDTEFSGQETANARDGWTRTNGFIARVSNQDSTFLLNGLWILRSALEDEETPEANIPAAAQWVIHAGKPILNSTETFRVEGQKNDPARPGAKFKGPSGFSKERWVFWKGAFEKYAAGGNNDQRAVEWSKKAVKAMNQLE